MKLKSYWYEIPVLFFLFFVIQRSFFPDLPAFFQVSPHPYWIAIFIFSLRYGLNAGLITGSCAASLYLSLLWYGGERFRFEDADFYLLPGLFVALGAIIGGVIDSLDDRNLNSQRKTDELSERNKILMTELNIQKKANRTIEQQVVSQMSSLVTLYHGAQNLSSLDRQALYDGILDFFSEALGAEKASLHLRQEDAWVLHSHRNWSDKDQFPKKLEISQGLIGKAGSQNTVVSLRDWFGSDLKQAWAGRKRADSILAGPLRREGGEVVGVFSVQDMPLLRFNSASVNLLTLLVDWAENAITKCLYFEELKSKLIMDEVFNVYNEKYFTNRSQQEFSRSKTYALPFSILLLSIDKLRTFPREHQVNILRAMGRLLQDVSRDIDIVTKFPDPDVPFAIMMMTASKNQAGELSEKIIDAIDKLGLAKITAKGAASALAVKIGVGSYAPEMKSVGDIVGQARANLN